MYIRKIVKSGLASFTVALPKEWITKNKLNKGDMLYVNELEGGILITSKPKKEVIHGEHLVINIDNKNQRSIRRDIVASYLNNYQQVTLKGQNISKLAKDIKETANSLIGMELIDEDSNKIVLRSFVHLTDTNPDQIVRRIDNIIRSMIADTKLIPKDSSLVEIIRERDKSVNKFVFLLIRIIKASMLNPNVAQLTQLRSIDCLFYWELASHLEKIGDGIKRFSRNVNKIPKKGKLHVEVINIINEFQKSYEQSMKSFYQKNIEDADVVSSGRDEITKKCDILQQENSNSIEIAVLEFASIWSI